MIKTIQCDDGQERCFWGVSAPDYVAYHDTEWGFPVDDDFRLFEKICLEGFQSGLSWLTILRKRENFRNAFCGFDFNKVATFNDTDTERLLQNAGIIRHRGKIEATINNAKRAQELVAETGSLATYFWRFEPKEQKGSGVDLVSTSAESVALSNDLKKRGWKFVGPTTVYAFMQAMGLVNDHAVGCFVRAQVSKARKNFIPPGQ